MRWSDNGGAVLAACAVIGAVFMLSFFLADSIYNWNHKLNQYLICVPMSRSTTPVYFSGVNASCVGQYCTIETLLDNDDGSKRIDMKLSIDRTDMICGVSDAGKAIRIGE